MFWDLKVITEINCSKAQPNKMSGLPNIFNRSAIDMSKDVICVGTQRRVEWTQGTAACPALLSGLTSNLTGPLSDFSINLDFVKLAMVHYIWEESKNI